MLCWAQGHEEPYSIGIERVDIVEGNWRTEDSWSGIYKSRGWPKAKAWRGQVYLKEFHRKGMLPAVASTGTAALWSAILEGRQAPGSGVRLHAGEHMLPSIDLLTGWALGCRFL